ncbi:MAG: NarK/NasA family nitrate transporter [Abitibacteriaceae bacterium]|nr:NarK/NasA family nitrate transporter [Abditibacteriaceae bacterium]MBV9864114.1 NarK/NasA family nitrate transporter [Abditibacteriaceae bacterium]
MHLKDFTKSGHAPTLFSAFLYFDTSFMVWVLLGPLAVFMAEDFHLNPAQKGLLVALPVLGGAVLRLVLGTLTDRIGAKKTALCGLTITLVPLLWGWLGGRTLTEMHYIGLLLGIAGASFAAALPMASRWYPPEQQGLAMGIAGAGNSGTVLAALMAPRIAKHYGGNWHVVFAFAMLPILVTWLVVALLAKDSPERPAPKQMSDYLAVLKQPDTLWFCLFYSITFGGFVGLASFLPTFFKDQYQLDKIQAGNLSALCVFSGSFLRPIGGYLADKFGGVRMLLVLYTGIALLALAIAQLPAVGLATVLLFIIMAMLGTGNGSVFQLVPQRYPRQIGVMTGIVGAAGGFGGFLLPSLLGYLKGSMGTFGAGFIVFALGALCCVGLMLILHPQWQRAGWLGAGGKAVQAPDAASSEGNRSMPMPSGAQEAA